MIDTWDTTDALGREAELLDRVSHAPETRFLWFWQATQSLVAPRKLGLMPAYAQVAEGLSASGWPVHLRGTGGDVTPQGPGIVNVTHVYAGPANWRFDLADAYDMLCSPIEAALGHGATRGWQPGAFCDGAHNVQWNGLKFAGTAMRFRQCKADKSRYAVMAHALMLFEPPGADAIDALNQFLTALGQDRRIDRAAHTGLPDDMAPKVFTDRLFAAFEALELPAQIHRL